MGPVRRVIVRALLLAVAPQVATAEVCDKERPNWIPGEEASAISEAIALFSTLPALALLMATALCIRFRSQWGSLLTVLLWTGLVSLVVLAPGDPIHQAAVSEGCVGSPALFASTVIAICAGLVLYTMPS